MASHIQARQKQKRIERKMSTSSVSLKITCNVQHRSDLIMDEHVCNVRQVQFELQSALQELESAKSADDIESWTLEVAELKSKSEKLVLSLQVMDKINTELSYARNDLTDALHKTVGDINAARKRVIWMEDKMGELCGKKRLKSRRPSTTLMKERTYGWNTDSDSEMTAKTMPIDSAEHTHTSEKVCLRSLTQLQGSKDPEELMEADLREYKSQNEAGHEGKRHEGRSHNKGMSHYEGDSECQSLYDTRTPIMMDSGGREDSEDDNERGLTEKEEEEKERKEELAQEDMDGDGEIEDMKMNEESEEVGVKEESTFMTVVSGEGLVVRESTPTHDLGSEYWQSEHHRFEFSEFADVLMQINPLSYHQMGLAVPGTFILKETETDFQELPWRVRRKGSDIKDVHRIALDKLASRVYGMCDKVYDATMLSVRGADHDDDLPSKTNVFHSLVGGIIKPGSSLSKSSGPAPLTAPASTRQHTEDRTPLSAGKEMKRGGTFVTRKLVFYPKAIPPPQVLPITRTSLNKEYPRFASSFSDPNSRKPAVRLVDQRNLLEETKLVLYHEKVKPSTPAAIQLERKFQKMLENDQASSQKFKHSGKKIQDKFKMAPAMAKFEKGLNSWNLIKPQSRGNEYSGLRWERVKTIVHMNLTNERVEERIDATKQLGFLHCGDAMVFYALKERLHKDPEDRVKYEAGKSLILLGCWEDEVIESVLKYLVLGNTEVRADLIQTLSNGKNVQYVDKSIPSFVELVKVLSHLCRNPDPKDLTAFHSAVCLGRLCVRDESAERRLVKAMEESQDSHIRAKALEILVKQLTCVDHNIVDHVQQLLRDSPVWSYRALACKLFIALGHKNDFVSEKCEEIYSLLESKLWDDPNMEVRLAAAKALTALGLFTRACLTVERKLEDVEEDTRAHATICVGTLGMKSEKLIRLLLEMLELDSSDYVRLMIVRTFGVLKLTDRRVLRCLKEREKSDGSLAREAGQSLKQIEQHMASHLSESWPRPTAQKLLNSRRVLSPILAPAT